MGITQEYNEIYARLVNENLIDEALKERLHQNTLEARKRYREMAVNQVIKQIMRDIECSAEHGHMTQEFMLENMLLESDLVTSSGYDGEYLTESYDYFFKVIKIWASSCHLCFERIKGSDDLETAFKLSW